MIVVVARNYAKADKFDEIMEIQQELVESTRKEDGNIKYELCRDVDNPDVLTMIEMWESQEALEKHMKSEHFTRLVPALGKFMTRDSDISIYEKIL